MYMYMYILTYTLCTCTCTCTYLLCIFLVLEFELRKAYDTIKSLRGSLTRASDITNEGEDIRKTNTNKQVCISCDY